MPIIKVSKKKSHYVQIYNSVFEDTNISWKAKGLLGYLISKPHDWKVWVKDLINSSTDGRDAVRSGIKELMETGYMTRERERYDDGTLGEMTYTVYEVPQE